MTQSGLSARYCVIEGRVQGVSYRAWTQREAVSRGLTGFVRNQPDGSVEALFCGPEDAVAAMIEACWQGPSFARVDGVSVNEADNPNLPSFEILR